MHCQLYVLTTAANVLSQLCFYDYYNTINKR